MRIETINREPFAARKSATVMSRYYNKKYSTLPKKIENSLAMLDLDKVEFDLGHMMKYTCLLLYNVTKALTYRGLSAYYNSKNEK